MGIGKLQRRNSNEITYRVHPHVGTFKGLGQKQVKVLKMYKFFIVTQKYKKLTILCKKNELGTWTRYNMLQQNVTRQEMMMKDTQRILKMGCISISKREQFSSFGVVNASRENTQSLKIGCKLSTECHQGAPGVGDPRGRVVSIKNKYCMCKIWSVDAEPTVLGECFNYRLPKRSLKKCCITFGFLASSVCSFHTVRSHAVIMIYLSIKI